MKKVMVIFWAMTLVLFTAAAWGDGLETNAADKSNPGIASSDMYVDLATMHRYVKNQNGTYSEYTRKGKFVKTVPADLPLLSSRDHVVPVTDDCYLLYVNRQRADSDDTMVLRPVSSPHPSGWLLEKALVDLKSFNPYTP